MGPSTNHSAGGNQTTVMPVIQLQQLNSINAKLKAAGRGKLLSWWEDVIETDPLIHFYLQKIWCCIHPRWREPAQATHAWFAFGPEELTSHPV